MSDSEAVAPEGNGRAMTPELPGTLRAVAIGSIIGVLVAFGGVAGTLYATGRPAATALGIGSMAAFWGGLGFGSMLGGTLHLVRATEGPQAVAESVSSRPGGSDEPAPEVTPRPVQHSWQEFERAAS
jgi:hypothetical protein